MPEHARNPEPAYERPRRVGDGEPSKVVEPLLPRMALGTLIDNIFFGFACLLVVLLAVVLFEQGLGLSWRLVYLLGFWLVLTYLALPRVHRVLTRLYVPDYFIGRTHTTDGLLADPVNLALRGSEQQVHTAMMKAGWELADPVTLRTTWRAVIAYLRRREYDTAPVSPLLLFGRVQSFAYQQDPANHPAQRHHVRFWPTPKEWLLPGGHDVDWLAAGTFDRAVGLSLFTWQVTHRIDADIDAERDYIIDTIRSAVPGVATTVLLNFSTGYHSRNGGGDTVTTDGNLPILELAGVEVDESAQQAMPGSAVPWEDDADDVDLHADDADEHLSQPRERARRLFHQLDELAIGDDPAVDPRAGGSPEEPDDLGSRPPALAVGVVLVALAVISDLIGFLPGLVNVLNSLRAEDAAGSVAATIAVTATVGISYVVLALLLWRTVVGRAWARLAILAVMCTQVFFQLLQWVNAPRGSMPAVALLTISLYVLAVYFLSSLSARQWTAARSKRRFARALPSRAPGHRAR